MARILEDLLQASRTYGWAVGQANLAQLRVDAMRLKWIEVPTRRGNPVLSTLRPVDQAEAEPNSLSARYGKGAQPLHTDGAHLPHPPDVVVLACETTSTTATRLWSRNRNGRFAGGLPEFVQHGVFLIASGKDSFFATATEGGHLRYDPGCMIPCDARARQSVRFFEERESSVTEHQWSEPAQVLLINNRRVLHARASAAHEPEREIQRLNFHLDREAS